MSADILFGNVMAGPLSPVATGDAAADEAIRRLQAWPMSPHTPFPRPGGDDYDAAVRAAEAVGPEVLLELLDDAAIATGESRWSDEHLKSLKAGERKKFKAHYDAVLAALAVRKAYLHWLVGAVCNIPAGLDRAIEIARTGTTAARLAAAGAVWAALESVDERRRFGEALDLREWDGEDNQLERVYRSGVAALADADPAAVYDRYAPLLDDPSEDGPGYNRAAALLYGLMACADRHKRADKSYDEAALDRRWIARMGPLLQTTMTSNLALMLLERLPADPTLLEPLCAYLPKPGDGNGGFWHGGAVKLLARVADARALPWLVSALRASWMNWPAVFEGFRKVGDPAMAHVIRKWLRDHPAPDRIEVGEAIIAELERNGPAPEPAGLVPEPEPEPALERPALVYAKIPATKFPKLDSLAAITKTYQKAFAAAELDAYFDKLAQRAVLMLPKRVNEARLELGGTKLGGHPDLPAKTQWPRVKREPLTFLAQINLAEVAPHLPKGVLPSSGLLSFFLANDPNGEAGYCEVAKVIHTPARAKLVRHEVPDDFVDVIFQAATVKFHPTLSLPSPTNRHVTKLLRGAKLERYAEQVADETAPALPQLLGFRRHGWDAEEKATSQLLLQLTSEAQTEMVFGDADDLSLFIHENKLAARDFAKVWPHVGD